jgi:hypothetical protein
MLRILAAEGIVPTLCVGTIFECETPGSIEKFNLLKSAIYFMFDKRRLEL